MNNYPDYTPCPMRAYGSTAQGVQAPYPAAGGMGPPSGAQVMPPLPTGVPTGPAPGPIPGEQISPTLLSAQYMQGYLRTQIGRRVRVEFLIGSTGPLIDRIGTLLGVGTSYILLRPLGSNDVLLCDLYSIKFVTFMY